MAHLSPIELGLLTGPNADAFAAERQQRREMLYSSFNSMLDMRRNILMAKYQDEAEERSLKDRQESRARQDADGLYEAGTTYDERPLAPEPGGSGGYQEEGPDVC